jgi:hypothetical protein
MLSCYSPVTCFSPKWMHTFFRTLQIKYLYALYLLNRVPNWERLSKSLQFLLTEYLILHTTLQFGSCKNTLPNLPEYFVFNLVVANLFGAHSPRLYSASLFSQCSVYTSTYLVSQSTPNWKFLQKRESQRFAN